jgi:triacylglycerol lipase
MGKKLDFTLAVLNGAVGDYLARTGNGLATEMTWARGGEPWAAGRAELAGLEPPPGRRRVVLVHGLMCTEAIWRLADGRDYGALLAHDFGYEPFYVRYNSGRAVPDNGADLARMLEALVADYPAPVEEIFLLGYSMGGLVARSACHAASLEGHGWLPLVRRAVYVGTPHRGAPLERVGRVVARALRAIDDPYTRLVADLGDLRSDGLKDLGDADLRHEDRARRVCRVGLRDPRHPVPLLPGIQHYLVAGTLWPDPRLAELFGDSVVPLSSATDGACVGRDAALPPGHVAIVPGLGHVDLPRHPEVYEKIRSFCAGAPA